MMDNEKVKRELSVNERENASDGVNHNFLTMESLILAQDERWRRASYMQVERESGFGQRKVADG